MDFLKIYQKQSSRFYFFLLSLGVLNSALYSGLLMYINNTISNQSTWFLSEKYDWMIYAAIVVASLGCNMLFQQYMIRLTNNFLYDFESSLLERLKSATYEAFEKVGNEKIYTAIQDTRVLGGTPEVFINAFNSLVILLCCFGYLFWISVQGALTILVLMAALVTLYIVRNRDIEKDLNALRDLVNTYYRYLNDLLNGFKEVKMSSRRNDNIHANYLRRNMRVRKDIRVRTSMKYMNNEITGSYSWYVVFGAIMFALPRFTGSASEQVTPFIVTILYLIGPVAVLLTLVPTYTNVKIAFQRLVAFDNQISFQLNQATRASRPAAAAPAPGAFESIRFEGVCYTYVDSEKNQTFRFGPVDLEIVKGETLFVTGGNGSGKSTFVHLLTGLYRPVSGAIYLNDQLVTPDRYPAYTDQITAIFCNNYLFSENYDEIDLQGKDTPLSRYVDMMALADVIRVDPERNVIENRLSRGQQKRLSMIYALLEERDVFVLDEWAAEQDPGFRAYFYKEFLPRLNAMGKTVVAITHDDEYFHCAKRVVKFNFGQITEDKVVCADLLERA
ncbi:MAG: cyclic peptide export ABC transporter [Cytophagales bacterium]|nr:cyclic peptide export ABC transporter [Cytophagales bacterium]